MKLVILTAQIGHYHDARYRGAVAAGVAFTVLATQNKADFAEFMAAETGDYPVRRLFEGREAYLRACVNGQIWSAVEAELTSLNPSVVAVAGWSSPESFAAIAWARRHCRSLVMLSESQAGDAPRSVLRERLKARVVGLCDAALVGGPAHCDYIVRLGIPRERAFMGYDAVDNMHFATGARVARADDPVTRAQLGMPDRYILASARFIAKKNLQRLVFSFGKAVQGKSEVPDLVILGDGPGRSEIEAAIESGGLAERVHLPGFRGYNDLPALYALSEGFVHVSTSEQWGLVINEAAAAGIPIVASTACGATEVLVKNGVNGFAVDAGSTESITAGLGRLMDLAEPQRQAMALAGQEIVTEWGPERFASGLVAACDAAAATPDRSLSLTDATLLRVLAGRTIDAVQ